MGSIAVLIRINRVEEKELDQGILSLISMPSLKSLECYKYSDKYCTYSGFYVCRKFNIENQLERKQLIYYLQGKSVDINSSENKTKRNFKRGLFINFTFDS